jgi:hypothetical protein
MERHFKPICIGEVDRLLSKNLSWERCDDVMDFKYSAKYLQICLAAEVLAENVSAGRLMSTYTMFLLVARSS